MNRKMLSMNSSTSWFCTSRKYSAIVSADSATRRRVPGGSSIWPKTSAVFSMTPDSVISTKRSLPSRVRSPTPANTDTPPKFLATRLIISWISTVLPTPAPPNRPILPPCTYGREQVDDLDAGLEHLGLAPRAGRSAGALRWIAQRSLMSSSPSGTSRRLAERVEHVALGRRRRPARVIGPPVSVTRRRGPGRRSGCIEMARTRLSPMCWATSRVSVLVDARQRRPRRAARCRARASRRAGTRRRRPGR